jgi:hypothetical protein
MKTVENTSHFCFLLIIALAILSCSDAPISRYEPKNQDEREIISLLVHYQDARNDLDIDRFLSLLHDNGEFGFQCGRMVSKAVLKKELPLFWADIQSGNTTVIPIVHECINGDYYRTGQLANPHIEIVNETAVGTVLFTKGVCRVPLYFTMSRDMGGWRITRTEWGDG